MKLPDPMTSEDVRRLFTLLGKGAVRFVGGCVRNAVLGVPLGDIDLATIHTPDHVVRLLAAGGVKVIPTGIDHGTVTAVLGGVGYEITTLRRDVETDGRRAVVAYTTDWAEDAARRDFTINSLYADLDGRLYDPLGRGLSDLERRKVVFVGDAEIRIREDYLRILRFFRFHSLYGRGQADRQGLIACAKFASKIGTLSRERVTQEFTKILMGTAPHKILAVMQVHKILPEILGKSFYPDRLGSLLKIQRFAEGAGHDSYFCARLFVALGYRFRNSSKIFNLLILNKKKISILSDLSKIKIDTQRINNINIAANLYRFDRSVVATAVMVAAQKEHMTLPRFKKLWGIFVEMEAPVFPVAGKDLMALGMSHGVQIGVQLSRLEKIWIISGFTLTRQELLARVLL